MNICPYSMYLFAQGMSQSCNLDMGNSLERTSLIVGGGKQLVEKVVRNRGPDNFEFSGQKLCGPHTRLAQDSRAFMF